MIGEHQFGSQQWWQCTSTVQSMHFTFPVYDDISRGGHMTHDCGLIIVILHYHHSLQDKDNIYVEPTIEKLDISRLIVV